MVGSAFLDLGGLDMNRRALLCYLAYGLGSLMILAGIASLIMAQPHPELATGGATLLLATGVLRKNGKNGKE
jgi:hypothetical protein